MRRLTKWEHHIGKEYTKPQLRAVIRGLEKEIKELRQQKWWLGYEIDRRYPNWY